MIQLLCWGNYENYFNYVQNKIIKLILKEKLCLEFYMKIITEVILGNINQIDLKNSSGIYFAFIGVGILRFDYVESVF